MLCKGDGYAPVTPKRGELPEKAVATWLNSPNRIVSDSTLSSHEPVFSMNFYFWQLPGRRSMRSAPYFTRLSAFLCLSMDKTCFVGSDSSTSEFEEELSSRFVWPNSAAGSG